MVCIPVDGIEIGDASVINISPKNPLNISEFLFSELSFDKDLASRSRECKIVDAFFASSISSESSLSTIISRIFLVAITSCENDLRGVLSFLDLICANRC